MIELAIEAGFEKYEHTSLSAQWNGNTGKEADDETLQVGEYPIGCKVLKFAELLQAEMMAEPYESVMAEMSFEKRDNMWVRRVTRGAFCKTIYFSDLMARDSLALRPVLDRMVHEAHAELEEEGRRASEAGQPA